MRTIKFRGFGTWSDCKQWYYGDLIHKTNGKVEIVVESQEIRTYNYEVDPRSVGEWTGLTDKNGKEIYEGDIVLEERTQPMVLGNEIYVRVREIYQFVWDKLGYKSNKISFEELPGVYQKYEASTIEVIGNIYENPDLVQKTK